MKLRFPVKREDEDDLGGEVSRVMRAYDDAERGLKDRVSKKRQQGKKRIKQIYLNCNLEKHIIFFY